MVDNHAARVAEQGPKVGDKRGWVSKLVIFAIFVIIIAALIFLT